MSLALAGLMLAVVASREAPPTVTSIAPLGGQRGTEVRIEFRGSRLGGAYAVLQPDGAAGALQVVDVLADKPDRCAIVVRIGNDCRLGSHALRLVTEHGVANARLFQVGILTEVSEPASDGPHAIALDCTVNGRISGEEADSYRVSAQQGQRICCEVQSMRLGQGAYDLAISVHDAAGAQIAAADDSPFSLKDPHLQFVVATAGEYDIRVRPAYPDSRNRGSYRLHVTTSPRPVAVTPAGGAAGATVDVTLTEADGTAVRGRVRIPDDGRPFFRWVPETERGTAPTALTMQVDRLPTVLPEVLEDGRVMLPRDATIDGTVDVAGEGKTYHFEAKKGERLEFRCLARVLGSALDPLLIVRYDNGRYIGSDDDGLGGMDSRLRFTAPADGAYRLEVRDLMRGGSPAHHFRLEVGKPTDRPATSFVTARRQDPTLSIPRGGAAAAVLRIEDFPKDETLVFATPEGEGGLPAGVTAHFGPVVKGSNLVPFVCSAPADTPHAAELLQLLLLGVSGDEAARQDAGYLQTLTVASARNDSALWSRQERRLAVAVADALPFRLELVDDGLPLPRSGRCQVKVLVHRDEGNKDALRVEALWTPSGIGSGRISIAGDKNEALLPLEANSSAMLGRFPLAVVATSGSRSSEKKQASLFAHIDVVKPWATAKLPKARTTQGEDTGFAVAISRSEGHDGPMRAVLSGLPRGVKTAAVEVPAGATEAAFALQVAADAAPGRHTSLRVELFLPTDGGEVIQRFGDGELRIDRLPAPEKKPGDTGSDAGKERSI